MQMPSHAARQTKFVTGEGGRGETDSILNHMYV